MNEKLKGIIGDIFVLITIVMMGAGAYITYKDMTKPAPDPFAKCVLLPSTNTANYWRCEK